MESRGWCIGALLDIHQFQAKGTYPVQQGMQAGLVQLRGQYRRRGFHIDDNVGERLTGRGPQLSGDPYFICVPGHRGILPISWRASHRRSNQAHSITR